MAAKTKPTARIVGRANTPDVRGQRVTMLVTSKEHERLSELARVAELSVSSYVRDRAFSPPTGDAEQAVLAAIDAMVDQMAGELDGAIAAVNAALRRMEQ